MASMHFIGLDIHKKAINYCIKDPHGTVLRESTVATTLHAICFETGRQPKLDLL